MASTTSSTANETPPKPVLGADGALNGDAAPETGEGTMALSAKASYLAQARSGLSLWRATAKISAVFCILIALGITIDFFRGKAQDPLHSAELTRLKTQLRESPKDEVLKQQIRDLDLRLRRQYFTQISRTNSGVYLLLAGIAVFLVSMGALRTPRSRLPSLKTGAPKPDNPWRAQSSASRLAVGTVGVVVAGGLLVLSLNHDGYTPEEIAKHSSGTVDSASTVPGGAAPGIAVFDAASPVEMLRNWPRFLGANAGTAFATNGPSQWDPASGAGVLWKVPAPSPGFNSPIIWENRVFFSGGPPEKLEVLCLDAANGAVLWRQQVANVPGSPPGPLEIPESTGYTAPTTATDGRRVYAIFANGDVAAFTLDGKPVWTRAFGPFDNPYGHATSLDTWRDRLILQLDQGYGDDGKSKIYAVDGRTGKTVWQTPRKLGGSWTSPLVINYGGKPQVIALSVPFLISYSAEDGKEIWRADCLNGEVTPSPIFAGGLLYVISPSEKIMAFKIDGTGDVTKTHQAWVYEDNVPDVTSPACNGELLFMVSTYGMLTCLDAKDGTKQWEQDLEMDIHSSPAICGNRLYLLTQKGHILVLEAGREYKEFFRADMSDSFHASPAFTASGNLIARGMSNIICLDITAPKLARNP